ncbi:HIT family protein [Desulfovibrio litoralis]|uniref:Diadenosine tetraphosphate (Ap4A) hydrolase n=1 Tax=Desulfovibrio litoralis DSM 11393 TaxID=1121455 RepID=A0A1M7TAW0_9BACT|nr:HIT domain-containing protein [Desulfovibrio litoralis]SHN67797.1 Diadenosine tetraphosphate (Ap4A) hydrolase [Desulfovibrio litoralis DSM 11393]
MELLWAPWRLEYILAPKPDECVFCVPPDDLSQDDERLILYRGKHSFVVMNKYPYSSGHLLIVPYKHVMDINGLSDEESNELMALTRKSIAVLQKSIKPQGVNVGLNLGEAAGAGIREHLHFHIVPRWNGDSSFMAICDEIRVIPEHLSATYAKLKPYFNN